MRVSSVTPNVVGECTPNPKITFVVENQEMQIESHYLQKCRGRPITCTNTKMEPNRFTVEGTSANTFRQFLDHLEGKDLPTLSLEDEVALYEVAYQHKYDALLNTLKEQIFARGPEGLGHILSVGCHFEDDSITWDCIQRIEDSPIQFESLISTLFDNNQFDALDAVLECSNETIEGMIDHLGDNISTALKKLIEVNRYRNTQRLFEVCLELGYKFNFQEYMSLLDKKTELIPDLNALRVFLTQTKIECCK